MIHRLLNIDYLDETNMQIFKSDRKLHSILEVVRRLNLDPEEFDGVHETMIMIELKSLMAGWVFTKLTGIGYSRFLHIYAAYENPDIVENHSIDLNDKEHKEIIRRLNELKETSLSIQSTNLNELFKSWYEDQDVK